MADKTAGQTQVAWALLSEANAAARLEAHRLRHLTSRAMSIVDNSTAKEHIYQVAGDLIQAVPRRLESLEQHLDRLSYALSVLGTDHLRERLPMSDRALVDESTHKARPFASPALNQASLRVAHRYLARLTTEDE